MARTVVREIDQTDQQVGDHNEVQEEDLLGLFRGQRGVHSAHEQDCDDSFFPDLETFDQQVLVREVEDENEYKSVDRHERQEKCRGRGRPFPYDNHSAHRDRGSYGGTARR